QVALARVAHQELPDHPGGRCARVRLLRLALGGARLGPVVLAGVLPERGGEDPQGRLAERPAARSGPRRSPVHFRASTTFFLASATVQESFAPAAGMWPPPPSPAATAPTSTPPGPLLARKLTLAMFPCPSVR